MFTIKVSKADKTYFSGSEAKVVMKNFNMNVQQGTIYAMMGSSGCGKTTLISCLVGMKSLDSGDIEIFGEPPGVNRAKIGYMPQDTALINDFTVRENIWFFGTIYGMKADKINERFLFLSDLLELPDERRLLRDCSGGEKRRVSFALTMVHEPELLILDEPTVGVDPILRSKIWNYLIEITTTKNVTVVLSTHYIEEARQSTHVGVMRNGVQLAEDTPGNILQMTETTCLEEAFLKLSEKQERLAKRDLTFPKGSDLPIIYEDKRNFMHAVNSKKNIEPAASQLFFRILFALLMKHFFKIARNIDLLVIALFMPLVGIICLHYGIGGEIRGLSIGIVNNEVTNSTDCLNTSLFTTQILDDYSCQVNMLSCRFVQELNDDFVVKKYYNNIDDAFDAARKAKLVGFIHFAANFSESFPPNSDDDLEPSDFGSIQIYLDHTDSNIAVIVRKKIIEAYVRLTENLMVACGKSGKAGKVPFVFESDFGTVDTDIKLTSVPGFIISASFTIASYISCMSIVSSKADGTWERTIAAGVKPNHYVLSHLIEGSLMALLQFTEYSVYSIFVLSPTVTLKSSIIISMMLLLMGIVGLTFGLLCSVCSQSVRTSFALGQGIVYPLTFVSGIVWPLEALPWLLRWIGYILPLALPNIAFRDVLSKNADLSNLNVQLSFLNLTSWILIQLFLCFWLLNIKEKEMSQQKKKIKSRE